MNLIGVIGGPLAVDRLYASLSLSHSEDDGTTLITNTGQIANGGGVTTVRGRLVWKPASDLKVNLIGDYYKSNGAILAWRPNDVGGRRPTILLARAGSVSPIDPNPYHTTISPGEGVTARDGGGVSLNITYSGDAVELTSISAYRRSNTNADSDIDGTALPIYDNPYIEHARQFSQELRLSSTRGGPLTFGDHLSWLVGAYYFDEKIRQDNNRIFGSSNLLTALNGGVTITSDAAADIRTRSFAFFGQANVTIVPTLELAVGARYSRDRKRGLLNNFTSSPTFYPANFTVDNRRSWGSFDPNVSLSWKPMPDVMLYASYAKGFKSGAFQFGPTSAVLAATVANPERLDAYQAGFKSELFNRRLRLNIAAFLYKYHDIQTPRVQIPAGGTVPVITLTNAAESTIKGFEIEGQALITRHLQLDYGYAYLDARYDSYVYNATLDFSGNRLPRSPQNSLNIGLKGDVPIGSTSLVGRVGMSYVDKFFFEPENAKVDAGTNEPSRTTVDASLDAKFGNVSIGVFGRNLTDQKFRSSVFNISGSRLLEVWAPRRVIGVRASANF